jgi:hypothetical protein
MLASIGPRVVNYSITAPFVGFSRLRRECVAPTESRGGPINYSDADWGDPVPRWRSALVPR